MIVQSTPSLTWIHVQKPTFDLVGVVLSSFGIAGICAAVALVLGTALGIFFIARARRQADPLAGRTTLRLAIPDRAA
jgi:ABC-type spermidine/putrescine transport system permease subunit II